MTGSPLISVILPVYNAGSYLKEAVQSILNQSYSNFEFLIINDGSTDDSEDIAKAFSDKRIQYISQTNMGLAATLNKGLGMSKGVYIARQDQDDISHLERLRKQVEFLEKHKDVNLLGTHAKVVSTDGKIMSYHDHATRSSILRFDLLFDNRFVHSSVMFRKEALKKVGNYTTVKSFYEDYDLWYRFSVQGHVSNLGEVLVDYLHHDKGLSKTENFFNTDAVLNQSQLYIEKFIGRKEIKLNDLSAVYHFKENRYSGTSLSELKIALYEIGKKVKHEFPSDKELIQKRCDSYFKVIRYKLNMINRKKFEGNTIKQLMLRLETKMHGVHPLINNH